MIKNLISAAALICISTVAISQHMVVLKNGERVKGEVKSINGGKLSFTSAAGEKSYDVKDISLVYFDETLIPKVQDINNTLPAGTVTANVPGRKIVKTPDIKLLSQDKGIVVVNVSVDKYGHVMKAEPGAEGTNTTSNYLLTKAKQAAEGTTFDSNPTYPLETKGTVTVVF